MFEDQRNNNKHTQAPQFLTNTKENKRQKKNENKQVNPDPRMNETDYKTQKQHQEG